MLHMEQIFITNLKIKRVRHLKSISIPLSKDGIRHLIFTGKNGSGKTSVVECLACYLALIFDGKKLKNKDEWWFVKEGELNQDVPQKVWELDKHIQLEAHEKNDFGTQKRLLEYMRAFEKLGWETNTRFNQDARNISGLKERYHYILAYYGAERTFDVIWSKHVEKVQLKEEYGMREFPRREFVKYLVDLKMTEALARNSKKIEKADEIAVWFEKLERLFKRIFEDETLKLEFDEETFGFHILQQGREPFDFNQMSSGYQAVLDIVLDLIMRMQSQIGRSFDFNLPGIVLIDEIETHLHLELQKNIMPLLTTLFPNIQFIVTTHSPFILNSLENAVIYDLENRMLVEHGLNQIPYDGIVEGYFGADKLSDVLRMKFERYRELVNQKALSDDEMEEIARLELYLDEIPDYLAIGISTEYQKLKLEFMNREDMNG